jgi:hypothetical protein
MFLCQLNLLIFAGLPKLFPRLKLGVAHTPQPGITNTYHFSSLLFLQQAEELGGTGDGPVGGLGAVGSIVGSPNSTR